MGGSVLLLLCYDICVLIVLIDMCLRTTRTWQREIRLTLAGFCSAIVLTLLLHMRPRTTRTGQAPASDPQLHCFTSIYVSSYYCYICVLALLGLGKLPHQIRGFITNFSSVIVTGEAFNHCTACSQPIIQVRAGGLVSAAGGLVSVA